MRIKRFSIVVFLLFGSSIFFFPKNVFPQSQQTLKETYTKKVMFQIPVTQILAMFDEDGRTELVDGPPEHPYSVQYGIDDKERVYLLFQKAIRVFDNKGVFVKKISWSRKNPKAYYAMRTDEDGNICLFSNTLNEPAYFYNFEGSLLNSPPVGEGWLNKGGLEFSHGCLYSEKTGEPVSSMPRSHQITRKKFLSDYQVKEFIKEKKILITEISSQKTLSIPREMGGFHFDQILGVDLQGNVYVTYSESYLPYTDTAGDGLRHYPDSLYKTYKYDGNFNLLAEFDDLPDYINSKTENAYKLIEGADFFTCIKWGKDKGQ